MGEQILVLPHGGIDRTNRFCPLNVLHKGGLRIQDDQYKPYGHVFDGCDRSLGVNVNGYNPENILQQYNVLWHVYCFFRSQLVSFDQSDDVRSEHLLCLLLSGAIITESDLQKRTDKDIIYLEEYREKISLRQFSHSLVENPADGLKLRTDGAVLRKLYYGRTTKEVETLFLPVGYYSGWDYKEFLENKYFYSEMEEEKQWQQKQ